MASNEIDIDECPICMNSITHSTLNCQCCNKRICLDCLILLKDKKEEILISDDENLQKEQKGNNIDFDENNEGVAQPVLFYKCPMCRTENIKYLTEFDSKYDFIKLMMGDYIKHVNEIRRLNERCNRISHISVNSKEYNYMVQERDKYKKSMYKYDNMLTSNKKELYNQQVENIKLKNHNAQLIEEVNLIRYLNKMNKEFTDNIHKIVNNSKSSKLKTELNSYLKSTISIDIKIK